MIVLCIKNSLSFLVSKYQLVSVALQKNHRDELKLKLR